LTGFPLFLGELLVLLAFQVISIRITAPVANERCHPPSATNRSRGATVIRRGWCGRNFL